MGWVSDRFLWWSLSSQQLLFLDELGPFQAAPPPTLLFPLDTSIDPSDFSQHDILFSHIYVLSSRSYFQRSILRTGLLVFAPFQTQDPRLSFLLPPSNDPPPPQRDPDQPPHPFPLRTPPQRGSLARLSSRNPQSSLRPRGRHNPTLSSTASRSLPRRPLQSHRSMDFYEEGSGEEEWGGGGEDGGGEFIGGGERSEGGRGRGCGGGVEPDEDVRIFAEVAVGERGCRG